MPDPTSERAEDPSPEASTFIEWLAHQPIGGFWDGTFTRALDAFRREGVEKERERCLRVLKLNNDNDAHRYYIEHPEFFK